MPSTAIFLFHRDLRLADNTALIKLLRDLEPGERVLPVFIFDPVQIDKKKNAYFSNPAVQFMSESLVDLDDQLKVYKSGLTVLHDKTLTALRNLHVRALHSKNAITKIAWNEDPSAFAMERDANIRDWAHKNKIEVITSTDFYLTEPNEGLGPSGSPYKVLSAFYKWFIKAQPVRPVDNFSIEAKHFAPPPPQANVAALLKRFYTPMPQLALHGGRRLGLERIAHLSKLKNYAHDRDFPAKTDGTSRLSPYLKFGCVSIREAYWAGRKELGGESPFIRELVFRDFYAKVYATSAALQTGERAVIHQLDTNLHWYTPEERISLWRAWTTGTTGIPLVDAGMRELLLTGHQHNRVRMLCASVLTKYMWIDWRAGAKFYYTHLVDADIFSNTAGWGFSASIGMDAVPYFRAPFNPFIQSKKFDPDAEYIKRWVPELASVPAKEIHKWGEDTSAHSLTSYPKPVLDCKQASKEAVARFKAAATKNN